ncbi:unnamed protein product [Pneumocystis jirovecii]|uniref:Uncharacterized protein n=1 Tax=Pneumocystis jirovecii TaxID=42068 RepID=L0PCP8_PNEJI|nr:unnamed protein product [Pneumocystis jirovecii]
MNKKQEQQEKTSRSRGYKELEKDLPKPNEQPSLSECIYYIAECNDSCTRLENKCFGYNYKDGFENIEPIKLT